MSLGSHSDFKNWGVVAFKDDTGLGRMAQDIRKVMGVGRHLVIPSERITGLAPAGADEVLLNPKAAEEEVAAAIKGLKGLLLLERVYWSQRLVPVAKKLGIALVVVPMWEWFRGEQPEWKEVDLLVCPHAFAEQVVRSYGWKKTVVLPWPLDLQSLPNRTIQGPARVFIHNAGLVDHDDRKGTRDTIKAFMKCPREDVRLIVRMQKAVELPTVDERVQIKFGNVPDPKDLYSEGDVAIQPSKMEGLGFMVLEPVCAGMPVITTDYPPMNEWVRQEAMRAGLRWFKRKAFPTQWVKHAHLRLPRLTDLTKRIEWCAANDMGPIARDNRAWAEKTFAREQLQAAWADCFSRHLPQAFGPAKGATA